MTTFQHDNRIREVLEKGVDLRDYSRQIENDLRDVEKSSIDDCTFLNFLLSSFLPFFRPPSPTSLSSLSIFILDVFVCCCCYLRAFSFSVSNVRPIAFDIDLIDPVVTDFGVSHRNNLPAITWICQNFLVAGHRRIENAFAGDRDIGAKGEAPKNGAVFESKDCRLGRGH